MLKKKEFSWIKKNSFPIKASRIDFALISKGLDQKIEMVDYLSSVLTDHRGIYMVVDITPNDRGSGYWKFNCSLLQNKEFVDVMNKELQKTIEGTIQKDPSDRWEIVKKRIKQCSTKFSKQKKAQDDIIISQLSEKINYYHKELPQDRETTQLMEETANELEEKTMERIQGVMFRSKAKWYEEGEKNTKYFFSLEKSKYNAKTCYKLINEEGVEIIEQKKILEEQRGFYTELYSKDEYVKFDIQNTFNIYIPENIRIQQEQQINMEDLQVAIKGMNNNKTPGEDGIPIDFYKVFWLEIKEIFLDMVLENYVQKHMHNSARKGILNLIPKPNKDSRYIKNLRPITLLNTDYKIIEKVIANKMIPGLEHIIHTDQRGFMKDRRISVNIRK